MKPCLTLPHTRGPNVSKCFAQTALLCLLSLAGARAQTNTSCAPQPQGLVGWWPAEGNANDIASGDNGTLAAGTTFAPGEVGQAFSLNGTNAFVQAPSTPALDPTTAGSMAAWVYFNQLPSVAGHDMEVIAKGGNGTDFEILADTSDSFHFFIAAGTRVDSATVFQTGVWYHVVGTWDSTVGLKIYVNGVPENTNSTQVTRSPSGLPLEIGNHPYFGPRFFSGLIDEAQVYSRALTDSEVAAIYNAGSAGVCTNVVNSPSITNQPQSETVECGSNAVFTVTATGTGTLGYQWFLFETNLLSDATNSSLVLSNVTLPASGGAYTVVVTNSSGSATSQVATLTVQDTIPPVVTLNGSVAMTIECHSGFTDPGATAFDTCAGSLPVTTNGAVNPDLPGTNVLAYIATDPSGNSATNTLTVIVVDTTPPVVTLLGANPLTNECHTGFFDPGATATDTCAGSLSVLTNSTVNPDAVGSYTISYTSTDPSGNSTTNTRTVVVVDTTPPVITLLGANPLTNECHTPFVDPGATATDTCAGSLSVLTNSTVNPDAVGSYTISYTSTDPSGNSTTNTRTVVVVDTTPPVITLLGANPLTNECHTPFVDPGATAADTCAGSLSVTTNSTVNPNAVGSYAISYTSTDPSGNSTTNTRTVIVVDTTPPSITCSTNILLECTGAAGTPAFFTTTASDTCDANPTIVCTPPSGSLFALGTNSVVCVATDASGNSNLCSFTVTIRDTTPPQIVCPTNMNVAEAPRDSGFATVTFPAPVATDLCDSSPLVFSTPPSGSVLPVGTNTITCTAVDSSGNSNSCTFTIRVIPYRLHVTVSSVADSGPGTLRQALQDANDSPDANLVVFNFPGPAPYTIHLLSALPAVTSPVIIDGWSQPGFSGTPMVELDGSTASNAIDGLVIQSGPSTVRGLALHGFATAIRLTTAGTNIVQGNYIGTDTTGTNAPGNTRDGLYLNSQRNLIGGAAPGVGNVICSNAGNGIVFDTSGATRNAVQGNFIGTAADGISPLGNGLNGIYFTNQPFRNLVGAITNGAANAIAFNGRNGISLAASAGVGNQFFGNAIFSNGALGVDLGDDGVTPNDSDDSDTGPNGFQNFPVLTDATSVSGVLTIYGQITSTANTTFRIDFFLNDVADPSGYGEGQVFLGSALVGTHGDGNGSFTVAFPVAATYTQFVTATATGPEDGTSEFSAAVQVRTPPTITAQPVPTNAPAGSSATFCAQAAGTPPFFYQWRLNGFNIPGATNACYTISAAELTNGGSYSVVVANNLGALSTEQAALTLPLTNLSGADYFSNRVTLQGVSGVVAGQNVGATSEPGEPLHAGKTGGRSVWYTWTAPVTGVATFTTRGSTFNTLLAVYSGSAFSNLVEVASDVGHGGFYTSQARFNGIKGMQYQIAIDGFGGAEGEYVLDWSQIDDPHLLPVFTTQPQSQTVAPGDDAAFVAVAQRVCGLGHLNCPIPSHYPTGTLPGLTYQWYFFDAPITGANSNILTVPNVQGSSVGTYTLKVWTFGQVNNGQLDFGQTNQSDDAVLQINLTGSGTEQVQAFDQLLDSENDPNVLVIGGVVGSSTQSGSGPHPLAASTVVSGFTGSQIFNTAGSGTGPGEVICGVIGGSSDWLTFLPATSGTLFLNTDGSTYDTVMAVFKRNATNSAALDLITCDNNSGTNGKTSAVVFPVQAGVTNYVVVDGINGATGILLLNYYLVTATRVQLLAPTPENMQHVQVIGRTNMHFILQASTNFSTWTSLLTTSSPTAIFDYIDPTSTNLPQRYYRALLLP